MKAQPLTVKCLNNFLKKEHACFGISPFNSYFSEERIQEMACWGLREFKSIHFFVPDWPSLYTLEALGYSHEKALGKVKKQCNWLINKILRALKNLGLQEDQSKEMILNWEKLMKNPIYVANHTSAQNLFEKNSFFREGCLEASRWVLEKRVPDTKKLNLESLILAAKYFLTEIPLFTDTAGILSKESSVFCYHQIIPFLNNIYQNTYPCVVSANQGFLIIESSFKIISERCFEDLSLTQS